MPHSTVAELAAIRACARRMRLYCLRAMAAARRQFAKAKQPWTLLAVSRRPAVVRSGAGLAGSLPVEPARLDSSSQQKAVVKAGLGLASELSLPVVLQKTIELACQVTNAKYGAFGMIDQNEKLEDFITYGLTEEERQVIGHLPVGEGILGVLTAEARPLRLRRIQDDPRSVGFPPNHPPMTSFLGVPISVHGKVHGNLYLTDKRDAQEFTVQDGRAVVILARQAGVAIENAQMLAEQERLTVAARHRLAGELHDSVSQALFSMTLEVRAAQLALQRQGAGPSGDMGGRLARLRELTENALAELRALIFQLRPKALGEEGLPAAIRRHAQAIAARAELAVAVEVLEDQLVLPPDVEEQVYRTAQEALTNVERHADASHASVRLLPVASPSPRLLLEVSDDGVGFDPSRPRPGHLGLQTMRQRVERLGGTLEVRSTLGGGTTIRALVPLGAARPDPAQPEAACVLTP
jgi:signal transduction histidine kinase